MTRECIEQKNWYIPVKISPCIEGEETLTIMGFNGFDVIEKEVGLSQYEEIKNKTGWNGNGMVMANLENL